MAKHSDKGKKRNLPRDDSDTESGDSGSGASGEIEFHDFLGTNELLRDDQLTAQDKKRLLAVHSGSHEKMVKKQKATREQRKALKEGRLPLQTYRQGTAGSDSQYRSHPVLANKAQFSGIDRQVNTLPTENIAETNQEKREELQYQYNLTHKPENAPRFNPKPQHR